MLIEQLEDRFVVIVVFCDLLVDFIFDELLGPDRFADVFSDLFGCRSEEDLKFLAVASRSGSLESVCASEFTVRAVMMDEAVQLDRENEDEDSSVAAADPRLVVFENRSNVSLDADADSVDVVVYALREESVEREEVRNIEAEVVHRVGELELDSLV